MYFQKEDVLIEKLLSGDESAYRYAVKTFQPVMLQVAKAIIGEALADEVVQESWISVVRALPKFEKRSSLKTWLLQIVGNSAKSRVRKESRSTSYGSAEDMEISLFNHGRFDKNGKWSPPPARWTSASPEAILASDQLKHKLWTAIGRLSQIQQTILTMRDMEGLEMNEICKILHINESNSRVLLHRARTKLWQAIEKHENT